ncbi:MAG: hypothetical protein HN505_15105 [Verrucomicrobia bacterium]|jgi:hypothetical protein|nr:hypothetical protein [Verrucomicrobiota bacterium]
MLGICLLCSEVILASQSEEELQTYITIFSTKTSAGSQLDALNTLQWSGLSDRRLFDLLEKTLLENHATARSKPNVDLVSWYAKSLGTSGLEVYRDTFKKIIQSDSHKKIIKYAQEGENNLAKYKIWNPIMTNRYVWNSDNSNVSNRLANMIRSDDWELRMIAAKRMLADNVFDDSLLMALDQTIKSEFEIDHDGKQQIQTLAWMCRALAASMKPEFEKTLSDVHENAGNKKVRKYAKKYLGQYY